MNENKGSFEKLPEIPEEIQLSEEEKKEADRYKVSRIENDIMQTKLKINRLENKIDDILKIVEEIKDGLSAKG